MAAYERRTFKGNVAYTITLSGDINSSVTSISVSDGSTLPDGSGGPFTVTIDPGGTEEKVRVTARTGNTLTVSRAYDGTAAASHVSGVKVLHTITALDLDESNALVHALLTGGTTGQVATVDTTLTPPIKLVAAPVTSFNGGTGAIAQTNGYGITGANSNPPAPAVSLTTVTSFITSTVNLTANTPANVTSVSLAAGSWEVASTAFCNNDGFAVATLGMGVSATSASLTTAVSGAQAMVGANGGDQQRQLTTMPVPVSPGVTTSYYLNAESSQATAVQASSGFVTTNVLTGMTAKRIG